MSTATDSSLSKIDKQIEPLQPIIIRRKKVIAGGGHHGGAWKVAYADFVTAMMAFFLLMWLLNATTEDQRKGISDYFNPSIPISRISGGGTDALSGSSMFSEDTMARDGTGGAKNKTEQGKSTEKGTVHDADRAARLEALQQAITEEKNTISDHLLVKMTPEGLMLELVEADGEPLFSVGNAEPSLLLQQLVTLVAAGFTDIENNLKIVGHTDASPYANSMGYTNWDLSSDRANTARRLLVAAGFPGNQISEVSGKAETLPLSNNPYAPENRRISITILRKKIS